eukprot:snap_masked-scaffold_1-processed-gene-13.35-mRNA-1 protein AED:1.00 eAED:1.00 QI:0/0/0/0/1/1/2/0/108
MEQKLGEITIKVDNQGTLKLLNGQTLSDKNSHMDMKYFYSRTVLKKNNWRVDYVPGNNNPADIFTKQETFIKTMKMILVDTEKVKGKERKEKEKEKLERKQGAYSQGH